MLNPFPCSVFSASNILYILNISNSICAQIIWKCITLRWLFRRIRIMQFSHVSLLFNRKCDLLVQFQYCNLMNGIHTVASTYIRFSVEIHPRNILSTFKYIVLAMRLTDTRKMCKIVVLCPSRCHQNCGLFFFFF